MRDHTSPSQRNTVTLRSGNRGNPNKTIINEGGLYALVMASQLAAAREFKLWVTDATYFNLIELTPTALTTATIRVIEIDGQPWFLTMEVLPILGMLPHRNSFTHHLQNRLEANERSSYPRSELGLPGGRPLSIISESGLYKLIMRSGKAEAREFQNWVTKEVLPAIRQTGCYAMEQGQEMPLPANEVAPSAQPRWMTPPCTPPPPIPSTPPTSFRP